MQHLLSLSPVPALPVAGLAHGSLLLLWGVVLAWLGLALLVRLLPRLAWRSRVAISCAILVCNVLPALVNMPTLSPVYWLGLAFQSPSLALAHTSAGARRSGTPWQARSVAVSLLCLVGVVLGWVLLLDTLAFWPRSVYALGFGAGALWGVALGLLVLAWRWQGVAMWALCAVLLAFAASRLPSGNLWDALLDPLLWFGLHVKLLGDLWAAYKAQKSP
jgi:hypothetical protein